MKANRVSPLNPFVSMYKMKPHNLYFFSTNSFKLFDFTPSTSFLSSTDFASSILSLLKACRRFEVRGAVRQGQHDQVQF